MYWLLLEASSRFHLLIEEFLDITYSMTHSFYATTACDNYERETWCLSCSQQQLCSSKSVLTVRLWKKTSPVVAGKMKKPLCDDKTIFNTNTCSKQDIYSKVGNQKQRSKFER